MLLTGSAGLAKPRASTPAEIIAAIYNPAARHRLGLIHSFIASGTVTLGNQRGVISTYWKAPTMSVTVTKYYDESGSYASGFDGRRGWFAYPTGYEYPLGPHEWMQDCPMIWLSNPDWFPSRWPATKRYANWSMIGGAPALYVEITTAHCGTAGKYFDLKSLREIHIGPLADGTVDWNRNTPLLQGPYGFEFPAFARNVLYGTSVHGVIWYDQLRVNVPLDDAMFQVPVFRRMP